MPPPCGRTSRPATREQPTALCLDRFERSGTAGVDLLRQLVADGPPGVHLVVSARHLGPVGLGRLVVAGRGRLLGWRELAFDATELALLGVPDDMTSSPGDEPAAWPALAALEARGTPELITDYLREEVLAAEPPMVVRALAAVAAIGGCTTDDLTEATAPVLGDLWSSARDDVLDRVAELPLVGRGSVGCWPHPVWVRATRRVLDDPERRRLVGVRITTLLERGAVGDAGRLAIALASPDALRAVVRSALPRIPVSVPVSDLRAWARSDLLDADLPERMWLEAIIRSRADDEAVQFARLEAVRLAFENRGDLDGEAGVLLQLGNLAGARGDAAALLRLLMRAQVLADRGDERALGLVALGRAVAAQLDGRPADAVRALDTVAIGSLPADVAAQVYMIRGTNLLLDGRVGAALATLETATGESSEGTMAAAHDLLSTARWQAADPHGAIDDASLSVSLATQGGPRARLQLSQSWLACLLAATGQDAEAGALLEQIRHGGPILSSEAAALSAVAEALLLVGDPTTARSLLEATDVPDRPVRSSLWRRALLDALAPATAPPADPVVPPGFERAVEAGEAGRRVLGGGAPAEARPPPVPPRPVVPHHPGIDDRGPLRGGHRCGATTGSSIIRPGAARGCGELCLLLALLDQVPRAQVAMTLWPDRDERSAGQNLRVTLSHLLDVLDPDRERSRGSRLVLEEGGAIRLDPGSGLRVDVWEVQRHAELVLTTPEDQRASLLAHARRLLAARSGPLLDGTPVGDWSGPHRRRVDDLVLGAAGRAGELALHSTDVGLAVDLGRLLLSIDPWSEQGHRLVIEGRLVQR